MVNYSPPQLKVGAYAKFTLQTQITSTRNVARGLDKYKYGNNNQVVDDSIFEYDSE